MINNDFVRKIQNLFNEVLKYEDEQLQALAREQIPLITLQIQAIERVREHQKKLKIGKCRISYLFFFFIESNLIQFGLYNV